MSKTLVIVESPSKIAKLKSALGSAYDFAATAGHILEFDTNSEFKYAIDIENNYEPVYAHSDKKKDIISKLKKAIKSSSEVILACDQDREGEMICWSIAHIFNLKNPKRIIFTDTTPETIRKAIKNPTTINYNIVDGQKTRASLDIIIGFSLSPLLIKTFGLATRSAGRVQSVVLRLLVEKEKEITAFFDSDKLDSSFFKVKGTFKTDHNDSLQATLFSHKPPKKSTKKVTKDASGDPDGSNKFSKEKCISLINTFKTSSFSIADIQNKQRTQNPPAPFITSTLLQEATKIGLSVKVTTNLAQDLYQEGYITYIRTDSPEIAKSAMEQIRGYVVDVYGEDSYRYKQYASKSANAQEAHEAIRPTYIDPDHVTLDIEGKITKNHAKLYSLIWKRTIASQMKSAVFDVMDITIGISNVVDHIFKTNIESLNFAGYLAVYDHQTDSETPPQNILIPLKVGEPLKMDNITGHQEYQKPPVRFNEKSLLTIIDGEHMNIGRPATYHSIIPKILDRKYANLESVPGIDKECMTITLTPSSAVTEEVSTIKIGQDKNKLVPSDTGIMAVTYLMENFPEIMDYEFTARMEKDIDEVVEGSKNRVQVLDEFYKQYEPVVESKMKEAKEKGRGNDIEDPNARLLGTDDGCKVFATITKNGTTVVKKITDAGVKYATIEPPLKLKTITLEDALKLLGFPKELGIYKEKPVMLCKGQYGMYVSWNGVNCNGEVVVGMTFEQAVAMIEEKTSQNILVLSNDKVTYNIRKGKFEGYGDYIYVVPKKGGKGYCVSLPKGYKVEKLTLELVEQYVEEKGKKSPIKAKPTAPGGRGTSSGRGRGGRGRGRKN